MLNFSGDAMVQCKLIVAVFVSNAVSKNCERGSVFIVMFAGMSIEVLERSRSVVITGDIRLRNYWHTCSHLTRRSRCRFIFSLKPIRTWNISILKGRKALHTKLSAAPRLRCLRNNSLSHVLHSGWFLHQSRRLTSACTTHSCCCIHILLCSFKAAAIFRGVEKVADVYN